MAGRPPAEKSFAAALRIEIKTAAADGKDKLRKIAEKLVEKAADGDMQAIKEVADRIDGKPVQQTINDTKTEISGALSVVSQEQRDAAVAAAIRADT